MVAVHLDAVLSHVATKVGARTNWGLLTLLRPKTATTNGILAEVV